MDCKNVIDILMGSGEQKTKYNGLMDTGTKEAASSLHLSEDSSPLLSMQTTQFFTLC